MKRSIILLVSLAVAQPAYAQLGTISKGLKRAQQVQDMVITDKEEVQMGEGVSTQIRQRFGVLQDKAVHRYVSLVGTLVAQNSSRPDLHWTFIVLDTDGVNAFASPGGFVHITRGALALIENEAELAGVLGHEIGHIAEKHTINAIRKSKAVEIGSEEAAGNKPFVDKLAQVAYQSIIENAFDRDDEMDADKVGVRAANKAGYAPAGLHAFLTRLGERNKGAKNRNGLFASHPDLKARQEGVMKVIQKDKLTAAATVEARYKEHITYTPKDVTEVPTVAEGSAGLVSGSSSAPKEDETKKEESEKADASKKRGFGLGSLTKPLTGGGEKQSAQVSASAGARGVAPDRDAKGGANPAVVAVSVGAAELAEFKKAIA
jgi:predicted Zn-dependent protease